MDTQPQSFRQRNNGRTCRVAKIATAAEAISTIEPGTDTFILTYGQFSLVDAMVAILDQTGPATIDLSTWTAADSHLQQSFELMQSGNITRMRMILDRSFENRQPEFFCMLQQLFGPECVRFIKTHAKFLVIRSASHNIVVRSSMNLNENLRLENIEVSESREFADFFTRLVDAIFEEVSAGEYRSTLLSLNDLLETFQFREVQADQIARGTLREPQTSHTLKKLS